jgi:hypothetical protein
VKVLTPPNQLAETLFCCKYGSSSDLVPSGWRVPVLYHTYLSYICRGLHTVCDIAFHGNRWRRSKEIYAALAAICSPRHPNNALVGKTPLDSPARAFLLDGRDCSYLWIGEMACEMGNTCSPSSPIRRCMSGDLPPLSYQEFQGFQGSLLRVPQMLVKTLHACLN